MVVRVGTASGASSILSCDICFTYIVASVLPPNALGFLSFASCVSKQRMVKPDAVYTQSEREKEREREREREREEATCRETLEVFGTSKEITWFQPSFPSSLIKSKAREKFPGVQKFSPFSVYSLGSRFSSFILLSGSCFDTRSSQVVTFVFGKEGPNDEHQKQ